MLLRAPKHGIRWLYGTLVACIGVTLLIYYAIFNIAARSQTVISKASREEFHGFLNTLEYNASRYGNSLERIESWDRDTAQEYLVGLGVHYTGIPVVRRYKFDISKVTSRIDGKRREILTVNGKYPGPLIEAFEGDKIVVEVHNMLPDESTSLHFHGVTQKGTNYMDGPVGFTQCGVPPGQRFTYEFVASPAGTHWYHAHWGLQLAEGLAGPLIIHPRQGDTQIEEPVTEFVILLTDLYNEAPADLMLEYKEPWIGGQEPLPGLVLMNGKQRPIFTIRKGRLARVRIINASSFTAFSMRMDYHNLKVTEVDSTSVNPSARKTLEIFPGQRYMADLKPSAFQGNSFWLRASVNERIWEQRPDLNPDLRGIVHYVDSKESERIFQVEDDSEDDLKFPNSSQSPDTGIGSNPPREPHFVPALGVKNAPSKADSEIMFEIKMTRDAEGIVQALINSTSIYENRETNTLLSLLGDEGYSRVRTSKVLSQFLAVFDEVSTVDFVISNFDDGPHPLHLHGHIFWILERGSIIERENSYRWKPHVPLQRDTVWLPRGEYIRMRLITDNPGVWLLHCHIPWHAMTGMQAQMLVLPSLLQHQQPPATWYGLCPSQ